MRCVCVRQRCKFVEKYAKILHRKDILWCFPDRKALICKFSRIGFVGVYGIFVLILTRFFDHNGVRMAWIWRHMSSRRVDACKFRKDKLMLARIYDAKWTTTTIYLFIRTRPLVHDYVIYYARWLPNFKARWWMKIHREVERHMFRRVYTYAIEVSLCTIFLAE